MPGQKTRATAAAALTASMLAALPAASGESRTEVADIRDSDPAFDSRPESVADSFEFHQVDGRVFKSAMPRVFKAPQYPRRMAELGGEGWVLLSYVVTREGTVRDATVLNASHPDFEQPAIRAAQEFVYEPERVDGQPIETLLPMYRIAFTLEPRSHGAKPAFVQRIRRLQADLDRGDLDAAASALASMERQRAFNLYEDAYLWWARAMLQRAQGDLRSWRESMLRAVAYPGPKRPGGLPGDTQKQALELLYADYTRTGELAAAIGIFDQLSTLVGAGNENPELRAHAETIRIRLAGDGLLQAEGYIDGSRPWAHTLWRDGFEFADIDGRLENFSLWCERRALELEIDPESSWQVPASWGACRLHVRGEPGTTFSLLEFSAAAEAPAPR